MSVLHKAGMSLPPDGYKILFIICSELLKTSLTVLPPLHRPARLPLRPDRFKKSFIREPNLTQTRF
jgi:hypothetical protein